MIHTFFIIDEIVIISSLRILDNENLGFRVIRNFVVNDPLSTMQLVDQVGQSRPCKYYLSAVRHYASILQRKQYDSQSIL